MNSPCRINAIATVMQRALEGRGAADRIWDAISDDPWLADQLAHAIGEVWGNDGAVRKDGSLDEYILDRDAAQIGKLIYTCAIRYIFERLDRYEIDDTEAGLLQDARDEHAREAHERWAA